MDQGIPELYFHTAFLGATIPIKMHMLEDHATESLMLDSDSLGSKGLNPSMQNSTPLEEHTLQSQTG